MNFPRKKTDASLLSILIKRSVFYPWKLPGASASFSSSFLLTYQTSATWRYTKTQWNSHIL